MTLSWNEIRKQASAFSKKWKNASNEEAQSQSFLIDLMNCFVEDVDFTTGEYFENKVAQDDNKRGYIDFIWKGKIAIEMKSRGKDLNKAYEQLKEYIVHLDPEDIPPILMVSDFENIRIYHRQTGQSKFFKLKDLAKNIRQFSTVAGYETSRDYENREEVNIKATQKMAKLHDALKESGYEGHNLELYLVRLLFCLFAGDTGIFEKGDFADYIENSKEDGSDLSFRIMRLFEVLNMSEEERKKRTNLPTDLLKFRYINGGLFEELIPPADFNAEMRKLLLDARAFNWSEISPAIFGSMFQGVMNKDERRHLGAHYTNEENILKVINPLFMNDLWQELEEVKHDKKSLKKFHDKICTLDFLDPACGCGNFLIITYRELRLLELEVLKLLIEERNMQIMTTDFNNFIKVNVNQFNGIEYEEFPCQIARVGMWLMDHQMNNLVFESFGTPYYRLPLTSSAKIVNGNALQIKWNDVLSNKEADFVLGNPPFVGGMLMTEQQKFDMESLLASVKGFGEMDYVCAWYFKAADYIKKTNIRVGFVSTNSICQGQQANTLWKPLIKEYEVKIDYAYRTFKWTNEAKGKAAVHCVIVGFSNKGVKTNKLLFNENSISTEVENINPYLVEADDIFIDSRTNPVSDIPKIRFGSMPRDGGNFVLSDEEKDDLLNVEPLAEKWIKPYIGSREFINNISRWCLWLKDALPNELSQCPKVLERVEEVRKFRANSKAAGTRKYAETPTLFCQIAQPDSNYIAIPRVSSARRRYIPIGFLSSSTIASDLLFLVPDANLYHFGILTSNVHNAWMRAFCGRLKSDYRYSKDIVYNNFPWVENVSTDQENLISELSKAILEIRNKYSGSSLADLYDPLTMPPDLLKAHKKLDKTVINLYSGQDWTSEADCVAALMKLYEDYTASK